MRLFKYSIFALFLFFLPFIPVNAQIESEDDDFLYNWEFTWGINKNTNGGLIGGLMARYSKPLNDNGLFHHVSLKALNIKHPKEAKSTSYRGFFVWGKSNYLYALRFQYGRERILFKKAEDQGVQVSVLGAAGPTLGLEAPYYIKYESSENRIETAQYDPARHNNPLRVRGTGSLFQGIGESSVVPGLNSSLSLAFEYGSMKKHVAGLELGISLEAYSRVINIMPSEKNQWLYPGGFITLFYGQRK